MSTTTRIKDPEPGYTYGVKQDISVIECASCGILFGITEDFQERRRNDHEEFSCPRGHSNVYNRESAEEKAKRLLKEERDYAARLRANFDQTKAELTGTKAARTRFKNQRDKALKRIAAGNCPICEKHFGGHVREHMKHVHPEAVDELEAQPNT